MSTELSKDDLYEVLSNRRRRYTVHALQGNDGPMEIGTIAEKVAAWENGIERNRLSYDERKRVYTALQQTHLPKMEEKGVVEYEKNRGIVKPTSALEDVDVYMEIIQGREIPWSQYYVGLSVVSTALLGAVALNAWPFTLLPDMAWAVFIVVTFLVSSLGHWYYSTTLGASDGDPPPELRE
ncbi:MAG: hypothetical protein ABEJ58_01700 [Halodesulfurarchaeum sp.]